jgi:DNA-binding winged helix-turn-helix (wHTH) protein/predicted ATPase
VAHAIHALGPFRLDTQSGLLLRESEPIALGRRAVALLRALVEQPGAVVSKDALIEAAWPNQAIEESNLTVQIAALRRVLGEAPGGDRWIETMPRRGYRFVGPVVAAGENNVTEAPPQAAAAPDLAAAQHNDAERRQITAMSCELVGNAGRGDGIDLEDWREAVGAFRDCVSETASRHDGFIHWHLGNEILVLFGYPAAHEQDAEQAVRAGLQLCSAIRALRPDAEVPLRCRVGIATGRVIVGDGFQGSESGRHEIIGDLPDLAARLQISTRPDTVAMERTTRRLIGDLFDCRELGSIETGSDTEAIRRWQVLGERAVESRFEALRGPTLSPLIGRDEEIDLLLRRWVSAKTGNGQVVLVSGEPGIGKSRLAAALAERLQAEPHLRLRYFCSPSHQGSAFHPFIAQLERAAGFAHDDTPAARLENLEAVLARAEPPAEDVALLADMMSLPASERHALPNLSPQRKKERILEALVRQLEGLGRRQPVLVVFEDAHWIDPTSRELLDLAVERVPSLPVLLIVTFRPEFRPPWIGQRQVTMLALDRLDRRDRIALAMQIAGGKVLPDSVVDQIVDRTDGVPLFVEELTKSVLESGLLGEEAERYTLDGALPPFAIPTSLHASLLARLDRLESARPTAQIGAVIGREFSYEILHAVCRQSEDELQTALEHLVASELVFQRGTPPDAVYSFKHALVQDTAYGSLLRAARQQLHAQIAKAIEAHAPGLMETQPELLAQHYAEAGLVETSVVYWGKAGHRSAERSALAEAAAQFQKGIDLLALLPDSPARQRQELEFRSDLGAALFASKGMAAPETGDAYTRARELWERLGSPSEFLHIPWGVSRYHGYRGEFRLAQRVAEDLLRLSRQRDDSAGLVLGYYSSGYYLLFTGRFASSRSRLENGLALYDPIAHQSLVHQTGLHPQVGSRGYLGMVLFCLGYPDQALAQDSVAIAEARRLAHPPSLAVSLAIGTMLLSLVGDDATLKERADELVAVTTEQGFAFWGALGTLYRGWSEIRSRNVAEGMSLLHSGLSAYRATGAGIGAPHFPALLASACEIAGQIEEAMARLDEALQIAENTGERWLAAEICRHKGRLLRHQGHAEAAEELYQQALGIAREQEAKLWELRAVVSLARLWRDQGRRGQAHDLLASVYGWFTEGFDTPDLKEAKALLDELL